MLSEILFKGIELSVSEVENDFDNKKDELDDVKRDNKGEGIDCKR